MMLFFLLLTVQSSLAVHPASGIPPSFTIDGEPPAAFLVDLQEDNDNLVLPCGVTGTPTPTVSWFRNGSWISQLFVMADGTLSIRVTEAEAPREGTNYYCVATNRIGPQNTVVAALRSRDVNVSHSYFGGFQSSEPEVPTINGGDVALECAFNPSNPTPSITWFANGVIVTETSRIQFLEGGRYLYIQDLTASEREMRYHCEVNNFLVNEMPIRAPTAYTLNTDTPERSITVYKSQSTTSGRVGETVQIVFVASSWDMDGSIPVIISCPRNNPLVTFGAATETRIPATLTEAARNSGEVSFTCQVGSLVITERENVTGIILLPGVPANITIPVSDPSLTDRDRLVGGGPVEYSCEASGNPAPTITWYYNGAVVQSGSGGVVVGDGTLTISAPQASHSGIYQCFARNQFGDDNRAWILEVRGPVIEIVEVVADDEVGNLVIADFGTTNLVISVGVNFFCATVNPCNSCPSVQWIFRGANITSSTNYQISDGGSRSPCTFNLTIAILTAETSGEYSAVFSHLGISQSSMLFVTVPNGEPAVISLHTESPQHTECVLHGSNIIFTCYTNGFSHPEITFIKEGQILVPGHRTITNVSINQIRIASIDQTDEGMYSCATVSAQSSTIQLEVCDAPETPIIMGLKSLQEGDDLTLVCTASGTPTPDITWTKNEEDVQLSSSTQTGTAALIISSATREDAGVYKCTALNDVGSTFNTITVEIRRREHADASIGGVVGGAVGGAVGVIFIVVSIAAIVMLIGIRRGRCSQKDEEIKMQPNEVYGIRKPQNSCETLENDDRTYETVQ